MALREFAAGRNVMPTKLSSPDRRTVLAASGAVATSSLIPIQARAATASDVIEPGPNTSFSSLKQIDAGVLNVGYAEVGPPNGSPVFLLHGWPYDIHDYIEVAPILAARGHRVIVPHLRGHGTTRFLETATPRSGQQAAIGVDVVALMDALKIPNAVLAGYDWGGRAACVVDRRGLLPGGDNAAAQFYGVAT
jgi:hypothetical protein